MTVETNPNYWDCECEDNYIHAKSKTLACSLCGMTEDESPDSRVNEIKENEYDICVWDIQFCKKDDDGNELLNDNGSVKLFQLKQEHDVSFIAEGTCDDDLEEIQETEDE